MMKPTGGSIPSVNKFAPPPPPLPNMNLMESIRAKGGFESSGLKSVKTNSDGVTSQASVNKIQNENVAPAGFKSSNDDKSGKNARGYDYRNELAEQLLKRREGKYCFNWFFFILSRIDFFCEKFQGNISGEFNFF